MSNMSLGIETGDFFNDPELSRIENINSISKEVDEIYTELLLMADEWFELCGFYDEEIDKLIEHFLGVVSVLEDEGLLNGCFRSY